MIRFGEPSYRIAAAAKINPTRLSGIANGRLCPNDAERERLASVLGVSEEDLFADDLVPSG
jgi:hypothetical protein